MNTNSLSIISESLNMIQEFIKNKDSYISKTENSSSKIFNEQQLKRYFSELYLITITNDNSELKDTIDPNNNAGNKLKKRMDLSEKLSNDLFNKYPVLSSDTELVKRILNYRQNVSTHFTDIEKSIINGEKLKRIFGDNWNAENQNLWEETYDFKQTHKIIEDFKSTNTMGKEFSIQKYLDELKNKKEFKSIIQMIDENFWNDYKDELNETYDSIKIQEFLNNYNNKSTPRLKQLKYREDLQKEMINKKKFKSIINNWNGAFFWSMYKDILNDSYDSKKIQDFLNKINKDTKSAQVKKIAYDLKNEIIKKQEKDFEVSTKVTWIYDNDVVKPGDVGIIQSLDLPNHMANVQFGDNTRNIQIFELKLATQEEIATYNLKIGA
jgi:hypothetical protein